MFRYKLIISECHIDGAYEKTIHEIQSQMFTSIKECFEDCNGKEAFEVFLDCKKDIEETLNKIRNLPMRENA